MAPAACDTIWQNFQDYERMPEDYDRIITGDLGSVGKTILIDLLKMKKDTTSARSIWTVERRFLMKHPRIPTQGEAAVAVRQ